MRVSELAGGGRWRSWLSRGAEVLALVADVPSGAPLAQTRRRACRRARSSASPSWPRGFEHVVLVDPPAFEHLRRSRPAEGRAASLHLAWGEAEHRFALAMLESSWPGAAR